MSVQKILSPNFEISVAVSYLTQESKPELNQYIFSYKISIRNSGQGTAQLISRHWIITDGRNHVEEVRGAGVVGLQPKITPNQVFEYESFCPLPTSCGSMKGSYQFQSSSGDTFEIEIPEFFLIAPQALH